MPLPGEIRLVLVDLQKGPVAERAHVDVIAAGTATATTSAELEPYPLLEVRPVRRNELFVASFQQDGGCIYGAGLDELPVAAERHDFSSSEAGAEDGWEDGGETHLEQLVRLDREGKQRMASRVFVNNGAPAAELYAFCYGMMIHRCRGNKPWDKHRLHG